MGNPATLHQQQDDSGSVPEWSGKFTRLSPGIGMTLVHMDDRSNPQFPEGWVPFMDPIFEGEVVIWILAESR